MWNFGDAGAFWGKGSFEAETYLKETVHPECGEICIGPAGENLVQFACVNSEYFRQAARGGPGAVMGSKNLKGVAIKGSGGVSCADIGRVLELLLQHRERYRNSPIGQARHRYGTPLTLNITHRAGMLPTHNFSRGRFDRGYRRRWTRTASPTRRSPIGPAGDAPSAAAASTSK